MKWTQRHAQNAVAAGQDSGCMNIRIIDRTTSACREALLVASLLDTPAERWGQNVKIALAYSPNFWDDPIAGRIAVAIMHCVRMKRCPTTALVHEFLEKRDKTWLSNPSYSKPVSLDIVEYEAEDLVRRYAGKRLQAVLGKAWNEAKEHPERAKEIANQVIVSLKEFI